MHKIEREMVEAINERRNWSSSGPHGFTVVEISEHNGNPYLIGTVYLHGNKIAEIVTSEPNGVRHGDRPGLPWRVVVDTDTLARWPTTTTKSRLRALGANVEQRDNKIYLDGEFIEEIV